MRPPLLIRVVQDTVSDHVRKRVTPQEIANQCIELARYIEGSYSPDLVVAIDTGGSVPGELLAQALGVPVEHVIIRRDIHIGRMYNRDPIPLRWMMSAYHHFLFHTVKPTVLRGIESDISGKKILVVDDAFHTGATADIAANYLKDKGAIEIKTAALAYVSKRKPDFHILPTGSYCFPWSRDYGNQ